MATVNVSHSIGDLANDLASIPPRVVTEGSRVVDKNVRAGNTIARRLNKASSGEHGKHHFRRLTSESSGLIGEYGFTGDINDSVGGGFRNGPPNTDLERSQDVIGPRFAADVDEMVDGFFW